jgi:hypothetical protein
MSAGQKLATGDHPEEKGRADENSGPNIFFPRGEAPRLQAQSRAGLPGTVERLSHGIYSQRSRNDLRNAKQTRPQWVFCQPWRPTMDGARGTQHPHKKQNRNGLDGLGQDPGEHHVCANQSGGRAFHGGSGESLSPPHANPLGDKD